MAKTVKIVVGSWGSYSACNERAEGSKWLDLSEFSTWEDVEKELTAEGFELGGIDAELFIQDIEGADFGGLNCDLTSPRWLFDCLQDSEIFEDADTFEKFAAVCEVNGFRDFADRVEEYGNRWGDDIILYEGQTLEEVAQELFEESYNIPDYLAPYIDYFAVGRDLTYEGYSEYSGGVLYVA